MGRAQVLVVDDEPNVRKVLGALLEEAGHEVVRAASGQEAIDLVRSHDPDLVVTDVKMPGMDGVELLRRLKAEGFGDVPVVLLTAHGTIDAAVEAMKLGALDFLSKPFERERVLALVEQALERGRSSRREFHGPLAAGAPCGMVGGDGALSEVVRLVERAAPLPTTVLITGETGTGKELVAEALHALSPRRSAPLVKVNCGALPEQLVESELFGHERGAFTGAERARPGRFELADGGTLFLDEIGEMPLPAQVKLLRVLQDGSVQRVGATAERRVDVRLVAATHRDLRTAVASGAFRADLLFRLEVVVIHVPPLRERRADFPSLIDFFLDKHARRLSQPRRKIMAEAVAALAELPWPGNVRELENAVERALVLTDSPVLAPADFGLAAGEPPADRASGLKGASRAAAAETEKRLVREALDATGGNVTRAAERLGTSRRGLQMKMKDLGLRRE